ncbi:hypothetical protein [Cupriavidus consociatus]|uniref:hypothetical protein n=1 Tax=Cupriavidus consociatus TaxID=2821357 RepID=UPI001AE22112|nr:MULTISPECIES: hypothetical protein [unclassified Cupriavidus]MBP0620443.1 hypothetical protein [Cupriavidus sp. LEh25]MDK2657100.1 hypothetical protein [Cupriavidus sp. LEh21]
MHDTVIILVGTISLVLVGLWVAWKVIVYLDRARTRRLENADYVTMCVHGENGMRFRVRRHVSELSSPDDDYDVPAFLRKEPQAPDDSLSIARKGQ